MRNLMNWYAQKYIQRIATNRKFTIYCDILSKCTTICSKSEYSLIKKQANKSMSGKYFLRVFFH